MRVLHSSEFFAVERSIIEDESLSWEERGLAAFLIGRPDGFKMSTEYLVEQTEGSSNPSGKGRIDEMLKKLEGLGIFSYVED